MRELPPLLAAIGAAFAIIAGTLALTADDAPAAGPELTYTLRAPLLARDEPAALPSPTATPTRTPTRTPTSVAGLVSCVVSSVTDGDTIVVSGCADAGTIRLILVDTPEIFFGAECYGREASDYTKSHLPPGTPVQLERDVSNKDSFGRYLRYVWVSGQLYNEQIVRDGYAALATFPPDVKYVDRIRAAQQDAIANNRGLWAACGGVDTPASPTPGSAATPTRSATATPTRTSTPFATPTPPIPGGAPACYTPGRDTCNCGHFATWGAAQAFHNTYDPADVNRLDADGDGDVCESLPGYPG